MNIPTLNTSQLQIENSKRLHNSSPSQLLSGAYNAVTQGSERNLNGRPHNINSHNPVWNGADAALKR